MCETWEYEIEEQNFPEKLYAIKTVDGFIFANYIHREFLDNPYKVYTITEEKLNDDI